MTVYIYIYHIMYNIMIMCTLYDYHNHNIHHVFIMLWIETAVVIQEWGCGEHLLEPPFFRNQISEDSMNKKCRRDSYLVILAATQDSER